MITPTTITLKRNGIRLEPLDFSHREELATASRDGHLSELWFTSVPSPEEVDAYISTALAGAAEGHRLAWVVREMESGTIIGTTSYHDIVLQADRVEIGYTWYAGSWQRTHVNTTCKLILLEHAFETLGCQVVGFRTDRFNIASQRAIAALGARMDGIIRHHQPRRDGSIRDTVFFSILVSEWQDVRRHLEFRLAKHAARNA